MELGLSQHQSLKQIQTLSPQMYMSMEILCLNALDLEQRVATELENNETLERTEPTPEAESGEASPGEGSAADGAETTTAEESPDAFEERLEQWDQFAREEYGLSSRSASSYRGEKDEKLEALSNTEGPSESLQEHLEQQIHLLDDDGIQEIHRALLDGTLPLLTASTTLAAAADSLRKEGAGGAGSLANAGSPAASGDGRDLDAASLLAVRETTSEVIYNLDSRGYLMYSLQEMWESLAVEEGETKPSLGLFAVGLAVVQTLDPPGVGGRDLAECLLLQLSSDPQDYPLEERIIRDHLDDLGHNRVPKIARALGVTVEDVKLAAENIASLNPLPGRLYSAETPHYVKPDVLVEEVDGRYEVRVESEYLPRLQINSHYRELYKQSRKNPEVKQYLKKKIDNAEWLLSAIRQRQSTLQKIAQEVVDIQRGYLDHGISHLKPLKMADVAERLGVHVSTISRAISGKYMESPRGIQDLKFFFTGGATKADGNVEARGSVIQRIKNLVAEEDKSKPLSDIAIVEKLSESGIKISRRTVTKYREAEGIPSSRERREY